MKSILILLIATFIQQLVSTKSSEKTNEHHIKFSENTTEQVESKIGQNGTKNEHFTTFNEKEIEKIHVKHIPAAGGYHHIDEPLPEFTGHKKLEAPPLYTKEDIDQLERTLAAAKPPLPKRRFRIQTRMGVPEGHDSVVDDVMAKAKVTEQELRRVLSHKDAEIELELEHMNTKMRNMALQSAEKLTLASQYAQAVEGKVNQLDQDHFNTHKLARTNSNSIGLISRRVDQQNADFGQRLQRHSNERREHERRLTQVEEAIAKQHPFLETHERFVTATNTIGDDEIREQIGDAFTLHGSALDRNTNALNIAKIKNKHLFQTVEAQGGKVDQLHLHVNSLGQSLHDLQLASAKQHATIELLARRERETLHEVVSKQSAMNMALLAGNKQVLDVLAEIGHLWGTKVQDVLQDMQQQTAQLQALTSDQLLVVENAFNTQEFSNTLGTVPTLVELISPGTGPKLAERALHPLFLKKNDPQRIEFEQKNLMSNKYEKLGKKYLFGSNNVAANEHHHGTLGESVINGLGLKKGMNIITTIHDNDGLIREL